ncbi:MAG: CoA transferase, partial [Deltaproteobacteria bacterium]|nr:CoA transferase [Deltaproteobacteria bacterium]
DEIITEWTSQRDRWEITKLLQGAGVAAFPSMSNKDLTDDPHLRGRGYLVQLEHPEVGRRIHAGIPWKMSASLCSVSKVAPLLGEDTEAVLTSLLKLSIEQIQELRRREITV